MQQLLKKLVNYLYESHDPLEAHDLMEPTAASPKEQQHQQLQHLT